LRRKLETSDSSYDKEKVQERLAKLSGGVALIKVGAATETEMKDRKLRLEDAVNATKAAVEEGIVPGGGTTLAHISDELLEWAKNTLVEDELIGALIVEKALSAPVKKIASNAGQNGAVVFERVKNSEFAIGYNAAKNELGNMFEAGIIDPAKVTRSTLQNAASIASMVLTTECIIVNKEIKKIKV
jgi:chaperonin GroEL